MFLEETREMVLVLIAHLEGGLLDGHSLGDEQLHGPKHLLVGQVLEWAGVVELLEHPAELGRAEMQLGGNLLSTPQPEKMLIDVIPAASEIFAA